MTRCKDKIAIVTGAASGIGRAIALELAREGAWVSVWDVNESALAEVKSAIEALGVPAMTQVVDVSSRSQVRKAAHEVVKAWNRVDILVNNAGICRMGAIEEIQEDEWDLVMAVNLKGTFLCSQAVMGGMKKQGSGKIINLGSLSGKVGGIVAGAHYSASKAAIMCFTKSLARELAPYGVNVNGMAPGVIETDMTRTLAAGDYSSYVAGIPMGRVGAVKEAARVAVFLASEDASYLAGEIIDVNGGQFMD